MIFLLKGLKSVSFWPKRRDFKQKARQAGFLPLTHKIKNLPH